MCKIIFLFNNLLYSRPLARWCERNVSLRVNEIVLICGSQVFLSQMSQSHFRVWGVVVSTHNRLSIPECEREKREKKCTFYCTDLFQEVIKKKHISKQVLIINLLSLLFTEIKTLCLLTCLSVARWATIIGGHVVCGWATGLEASLRSHRRSRDTGKEELPVLYLCPHQHQTTAATVHNFSIASFFSRYELTW